MKSDHQFKAERVLARHCDALIARGPAPREPKLVVQEFAQSNALRLGRSLAPLLGGTPVKLAAEELSEGSLSAWRDSLHVSSKAISLSGPAGRPEVLVALDLASAMVLTDIAFGGVGKAPKELPEEWPAASHSVAENLGREVAQTLAGTLELPEPLKATAQWQDSAKAALLCGANELLFTSIAPVDTDGMSWSMAIAVPLRHAKLLDSSAGAQTPREYQSTPSLDRGPFSGIPLPARCELTQIRLPIARAAELKPGDIFPLAIPREVPIEIAGRKVARGAIGSLDDRIAIEVTQLGQL